MKVQDASGNTTQFKIKTATALKKLMSTYCERNGLDVQVSVAFFTIPMFEKRPSNLLEIKSFKEIRYQAPALLMILPRASGSHLTVSE